MSGIDFFDILGYIGMGIVSAGIMLALCMFLCRRHQTMFHGENVIKREGKSEPAAVDGEDEEKLVVNKEAPNGEWVMSFNVIKSRSRVEWNNAFLFSIVEICVAAAFLLFVYTSFSLLKSIGIGVLVGIAIFSFMILMGRIVIKVKGEFRSQYLIFTIISCCFTGTFITFLMIKWGLFNLF